MPKKKTITTRWTIKPNDKLLVYFKRMGVIDARTNKFSKAWNFNQFAIQCIVGTLESGKHGYNDLATPTELELALAEHELKHTATQWSSIGEEFKKLKERVNELEEELQKERAGIKH